MTNNDIASDAPIKSNFLLNAIDIGLLPLPVYAAVALVTGVAIWMGKLPNDVIGGLLVLMMVGILLGKLGQTVPILKEIGGTAILCLFVPSALVGYGLMPASALAAITTTFKTANYQYSSSPAWSRGPSWACHTACWCRASSACSCRFSSEP